MMEEVLVIGHFEINVGVIFVVAHHLIRRCSVVARFLAVATTAAGWIISFLLDAFMFGATILEPDFHLRFGEVQVLGQLFAFGTDDVVILLESVFQLEQLAGREGRPHAFRLAEGRQ